SATREIGLCHSDPRVVDSHPGERAGGETSTSAVRAARQYDRYLGSKDQSRTFSASHVDERLVENVANVEAGNDENIRIAGDVGQNALCPCRFARDGVVERQGAVH